MDIDEPLPVVAPRALSAIKKASEPLKGKKALAELQQHTKSSFIAGHERSFFSLSHSLFVFPSCFLSFYYPHPFSPQPKYFSSLSFRTGVVLRCVFSMAAHLIVPTVAQWEGLTKDDLQKLKKRNEFLEQQQREGKNVMLKRSVCPSSLPSASLSPPLFLILLIRIPSSSAS